MESNFLNDLDISEKEKKILASAIDIFSEKGFSAATTSEIAKNAGVAEGTIFRYFKTKKDILRGIMLQTINILAEKLVLGSLEKILLTSEDTDIKTILKKILYDRMKLTDKVFPMARVVLTEALFHEDIREAIYQNIISKALDMFKVFHSHMSDRGLLRKDVNPEVLFRSILGNIGILIVQRKLFSDKFEVADFDKEVDKMIDVLLYGITNTSAS